jgi:hypothetical protein
MPLKRKQLVQNLDRDHSYRVQRLHRDGTVTVSGWFALRPDGSEMLGTFSGDLTFRRLDPSVFLPYASQVAA